MCRKTSKSENLLFAGSVSKKGQAKPALFWEKNNATPGPLWFFVVFTWFEGEAASLSNPNQPGKKQGFTF
ncbi:MAG: hypothetical protein LBC37_06230 [Zoogloeaceae bacterium]|jgi:hypothetical protein|nr:hypothetical protein [Zoogloeaceae bacterium]